MIERRKAARQVAGARHAARLALCVGFALGAALPATVPAFAAPAPSEPGPGAQPTEAPTPAEPKPMTREQILELPVFKRYDIPWEKGEALLGDVKDETFGYDEAAFYWLVAQVNKLPPSLMKPDEEVTSCRTLLSLPSSYRGKPVTVRGVYLQVTPFRVPVLALRKDVPYLHECDIREHPIEKQGPLATVIVIEDPMTYLERGDDVRVKGYFYKIRKYQGTKGIGLAPMLVARRIEWEEPTYGRLSAPVVRTRTDLLLGLMFGVLVVLVVVFFFIKRLGRSKANANRGRPIHQIRLQRPDRPPPFEESGPGGEGGSQEP